MQDTNPSVSRMPAGSFRPTDFLAFSRQYAARMGLKPDVTNWKTEEFQAFLDWWLLTTMRDFVESDSA